MSDKNRKAGLLVGGIFISIALVFLLISIGFKHIGVKKKDALSTQGSVSSYTDTANTSNITPQAEQAEENVWGTEGGNDSTATSGQSPTTDSEPVPEVDANESQGTGTDTKAEDTEVEDTKVEEESQGTDTADTAKSDDSSSDKTVATTDDASQVGVWTEINESSIDYSVDELHADGVVSKKKVYLTTEGTLVYCIDIDCKVDGEKRVLSYYCGYSAYANVEEGDLVLVKYKNPTGSTIMVTKVEVN